MTEYARIEGLAEVTRALRDLPAQFASSNGGPLRRALYRGAVLIRDEAIARAPRDGGNLANQIYIFRDRNPKGSTGANERYIIGVRMGGGKKTFRIRTRGRFAGRAKARYQNDAYYWKFVEFGHKARNGEDVPMQPFMRPAFENRKRDVVVEFTAVMKTGVDAAARRARKASGGK